MAHRWWRRWQARLLDLIGVTCNRNTLPTDESAARPTGIRLGTPWITQRGFKEPEIERLAAAIALVLKNAKPFGYDGKGGKADMRAKIDYATYVEAQNVVATLCDEAGIDYNLPVLGKRQTQQGRAHFLTLHKRVPEGGISLIEVRGPDAAQFLRYALTSVSSLKAGEEEPTNVLAADGSVLAQGILQRLNDDTFQLHVNGNGTKVAHWLQALSDGFVIYDDADIYGKIPGAVAIRLQTNVSAHLDLLRLTPEMGYAHHPKGIFRRRAWCEIQRTTLGGAARRFDNTWHEDISGEMKELSAERAASQARCQDDRLRGLRYARLVQERQR
ncbi:MAG: hypothetical protein U0528_07065 [Anaerolineae bacterium]